MRKQNNSETQEHRGEADSKTKVSVEKVEEKNLNTNCPSAALTVKRPSDKTTFTVLMLS